MVDFASSAMNSTVAARFATIVAAYPTHWALRTAQACWSYAELDTHARHIAQQIVAQCGSTKGQVAVFCETLPWQMAATLAVIKSGKTVIVLDPSLPDERLRFILADAQVNVLLVDPTLAPRADSAFSAAATAMPLAILPVDMLPSADAGEDLALSITGDDPLVLIYTSGSTGQPKGVVITHQAELHSAWSKQQTLPLGPHPRGAVISSLAYAATWGMAFRLLLCGGCLCAYDFKTAGFSGLAAWLAAEQITLMVPPIALIRQWCSVLTTPLHLDNLRAMEFIGALVNQQDLIQLRACLLGDYTITLLYGSTEALNLTAYRVTALDTLPAGTLPAGYLIPDTQALIIDEQGQPVAPGVVGEIVIRSRYLSPGYWQRPTLTQRKFTRDPQDPAVRCFFTGDLGRQDADGCLHITGRKDLMVKIRGYQVELSEVEQAMCAVAGVQHAAVVACDQLPIPAAGRGAEKALVAYVVPQPSMALSERRLRHALAQHLPLYMLPARIVYLAQLPLTPSGKIDRQALLRLADQTQQERPALDTAYQPPRTPLEAQLVAIWAEVLGTQLVGITDPFLALGGDSLRAMQVHARLRNQHAIELPAEQLFACDTIAQLALHITEWQAHQLDPAILSALLTDLEAQPDERAAAFATPAVG